MCNLKKSPSKRFKLKNNNNNNNNADIIVNRYSNEHCNILSIV